MILQDDPASSGADCECSLYKVNAFPDLRGKIINIKKE